MTTNKKRSKRRTITGQNDGIVAYLVDEYAEIVKQRKKRPENIEDKNDSKKTESSKDEESDDN